MDFKDNDEDDVNVLEIIEVGFPRAVMFNGGPRKLSGYQYKKQRLEKETQKQKQAGSLKNYLQSTSGNTKTTDDANNSSLNRVIKENTQLSESDDDQKMDDISKSTGTGTIIVTNVALTDSALQILSTDLRRR
ncbi:hypothetical protein FQA39_LY10534 [Lamprigera yunnana]|nr:hypothetical protein FQA39_LY10534 [Lamprigera yunnana]